MFSSKTSRADQVIQDARKLAEDISSLARDAGHETKDTMNAAAQRAAGTYHQAEKAMKRKAHDIDELAHEKPWVAVGIAAVVGATLASLLMRRK